MPANRSHPHGKPNPSSFTLPQPLPANLKQQVEDRWENAGIWEREPKYSIWTWEDIGQLPEREVALDPNDDFFDVFPPIYRLDAHPKWDKCYLFLWNTTPEMAWFYKKLFPLMYIKFYASPAEARHAGWVQLVPGYRFIFVNAFKLDDELPSGAVLNEPLLKQLSPPGFWAERVQMNMAFVGDEHYRSKHDGQTPLQNCYKGKGARGSKSCIPVMMVNEKGSSSMAPSAGIKADARFAALAELYAKVNPQLIKITMRFAYKEEIDDHLCEYTRHIDGFTYGDPELNGYHGSSQWNHHDALRWDATQADRLDRSASMGLNGIAHMDLKDLFAFITDMSVESDLLDGSDPGSFFVIPWGAFVVLEKFLSITFSGDYPHVSTPAMLPINAPLKCFKSKRVANISYPTGNALQVPGKEKLVQLPPGWQTAGPARDVLHVGHTLAHIEQARQLRLRDNTGFPNMTSHGRHILGSDQLWINHLLRGLAKFNLSAIQYCLPQSLTPLVTTDAFLDWLKIVNEATGEIIAANKDTFKYGEGTVGYDASMTWFAAWLERCRVFHPNARLDNITPSSGQQRRLSDFFLKLFPPNQASPLLPKDFHLPGYGAPGNTESWRDPGRLLDSSEDEQDGGFTSETERVHKRARPLPSADQDSEEEVDLRLPAEPQEDISMDEHPIDDSPMDVDEDSLRDVQDQLDMFGLEPEAGPSTLNPAIDPKLLQRGDMDTICDSPSVHSCQDLAGNELDTELIPTNTKGKGKAVPRPKNPRNSKVDRPKPAPISASLDFLHSENLPSLVRFYRNVRSETQLYDKDNLLVSSGLKLHKQLLPIVRSVMTDPTSVSTLKSIYDAWSILSATQAKLRHLQIVFRLLRRDEMVLTAEIYFWLQTECLPQVTSASRLCLHHSSEEIQSSISDDPLHDLVREIYIHWLVHNGTQTTLHSSHYFSCLPDRPFVLQGSKKIPPRGTDFSREQNLLKCVEESTMAAISYFIGFPRAASTYGVKTKAQLHYNFEPRDLSEKAKAAFVIAMRLKFGPQVLLLEAVQDTWEHLAQRLFDKRGVRIRPDLHLSSDFLDGCTWLEEGTEDYRHWHTIKHDLQEVEKKLSWYAISDHGSMKKSHKKCHTAAAVEAPIHPGSEDERVRKAADEMVAYLRVAHHGWTHAGHDRHTKKTHNYLGWGSKGRPKRQEQEGRPFYKNENPPTDDAWNPFRDKATSLKIIFAHGPLQAEHIRKKEYFFSVLIYRMVTFGCPRFLRGEHCPQNSNWDNVFTSVDDFLHHRAAAEALHIESFDEMIYGTVNPQRNQNIPSLWSCAVEWEMCEKNRKNEPWTLTEFCSWIQKPEHKPHGLGPLLAFLIGIDLSYIEPTAPVVFGEEEFAKVAMKTGKGAHNGLARIGLFSKADKLNHKTRLFVKLWKVVKADMQADEDLRQYRFDLPNFEHPSCKISKWQGKPGKWLEVAAEVAVCTKVDGDPATAGIHEEDASEDGDEEEELEEE